MQSQADTLQALAGISRAAPASATRRPGCARWLGLGLETHISLPLFAASCWW